MNHDAFDQARMPGTLIKTDYIQHVSKDGRPDSRLVKGWAFIPDPLPPLESIRECIPNLINEFGMAMDAVGRLDEFSKQSPGGFNFNPWTLFSPLRLREARLSSRIENTVASAKEVALVGRVPADRSEPLEVNNYLRAVSLASKSNQPITEAGIRQLHNELLSGLPDSVRKNPGQYRPTQVYIGDEQLGFENARYVPPPPDRVPQLMKDLVDHIRSVENKLPKLLMTGLAHYQFEAIHPFMDGNGRLGRMLITLSLCSDGLLGEPFIYPSGHIERTKQRYYDSLYRVSVAGDWEGWLRYYLEIVESSARETLERMHRLLELREDINERLRERQHSHRIIKAVDVLFEDLIVSSKSLNDKIGGTAQTSRNYIKALEEIGAITPIPGRKRDVLYIASEIMRVADED